MKFVHNLNITHKKYKSYFVRNILEEYSSMDILNRTKILVE